MKNLMTFILLIFVFICTAQSKKEIQQKLVSLETSQSSLLQEVNTLKQDVAVLRSELESVKRENDFLKQMIASGSGKQGIQDSTKQGLTTNPGAAPGRCKAITSKGAQCSRTADVGSEYCWQHKKTYEPNSTTPTKSSGTSGGSSGSGHEIQTGPRGGKYYINSKGNKVYIKK
jgi:colicin import membrane protein